MPVRYDPWLVYVLDSPSTRPTLSQPERVFVTQGVLP